MATILRILNNTVTLDLNDNVNYRLSRNRWTPKVAGLVDDLFLPHGPYGTVDEEIELEVLGGASNLASVVMDNIEAISEIILGAERWYEGENTANGPVYLEYSPAGSSVGATPYRTMVMGRHERDKPANAVQLPNEFHDAHNVGTIEGVRIRLCRHGWWLGALETATSSTTANPSVLTGSFSPATDQYSPVAVEFSGLHDAVGNLGAAHAVPSGIIAITNGIRHIQIYQGEANTASTSTAISGTEKATGNAVLRFTANGAVQTKAWTIATLDQKIGRCQQIVFIGMVRNNSATEPWKVYMDVRTIGKRYITSDTMIIPAATSGPRPDAMILGSITTDGDPIELFEIFVEAAGAVATLDIDYIALIGLPNETGRIVQLLTETSLEGTGYGSSNTAHRFKIDHKLFTERQPFIGVETAAGIKSRASYRGDPMLVMGGGTVLDGAGDGGAVSAALFMSGPSRWKAVDTTDATISNQMTIKRRKATLIAR